MLSHNSTGHAMANIVPLASALLSLCSVCTKVEAKPGGLRFSKRCLMVSPNEGCAVADINRDGKPDIIAGTHWFAAPDFVLARPYGPMESPTTGPAASLLSNGKPNNRSGRQSAPLLPKVKNERLPPSTGQSPCRKC